MIFSTKAFLIFLPIVLLGYHLLKTRTWKYRWLLLGSWVFYGLVSPRYLWVLLLLTWIDYAVALRIENAETTQKKKRWLTISIVANLGLLAAFKYTPFVYDNTVSFLSMFGVVAQSRAWEILLPLGISFHTFQGISYTVDVYRGQIKAVKDKWDYALFVAYFPQMAAGPIVRAAEFLPQMVTPPRVSSQQRSEGLHLFVRGLVKKLIIADWLDTLLVTPAFTTPDAFSPAALRWAMVAWAVQIYTDFSGYTDMARGISKWFGFELPENFHLPYLATSVSDFWRRWHVSFSTWLRDYLYFPLGGSRCGAWRADANMLLVFVLCGLWHGASWNWLVYGLFYGTAMILHRHWDKYAKTKSRLQVLRSTTVWLLVAWAGTMTFHILALVLVRMPSGAVGVSMAKAIIPDGSSASVMAGVPLAVPLLIMAGLWGHLIKIMPLKVLEKDSEYRGAIHGLSYACALAAAVCFTPGVGKSFIYIQF